MFTGNFYKTSNMSGAVLPRQAHLCRDFGSMCLQIRSTEVWELGQKGAFLFILPFLSLKLMDLVQGHHDLCTNL